MATAYHNKQGLQQVTLDLDLLNLIRVKLSRFSKLSDTASVTSFIALKQQSYNNRHTVV